MYQINKLIISVLIVISLPITVFSVELTRSEYQAQLEQTYKWFVVFDSKAFGSIYDSNGRFREIKHLSDFNCVLFNSTSIGHGVTGDLAIDVRERSFYLDNDLLSIDSPYCNKK
jgi:hypothetical protein